MLNRTSLVTSSLPTSQQGKWKDITGVVLGHTAGCGGDAETFSSHLTPFSTVLCCLLLPGATHTSLGRMNVPIPSPACFRFALRTPEIQRWEQLETQPTSELKDGDEFAPVTIKIQRLITLHPVKGLLQAVSQKKIF